MTQDDTAELTELERRGWDSLCSQRGADFYADLMTDDAVMVLAPGFVLDRSGVAASLRHAPPWDDYELSDVRGVEVGDDSRALVYRATARRDGEEFAAWMTSVYRRVGDRWRLALYQQTPVTG